MTFIILHGTKGTPEGNWFPWLSSQLEKEVHTVIRPTLPTPEGQTPENWIAVIEETVQEAELTGEQIILIAHSMSALAACLYLQRRKTPIAACFFVAGFAQYLPNTPDPYPALNNPFIDTPIDWVKVKENCRTVVCFGSDNDPYVPLPIAKDFASKLSAKFILVSNAGHFGTSTGYDTFPLLLQTIHETV